MNDDLLSAVDSYIAKRVEDLLELPESEFLDVMSLYVTAADPATVSYTEKAKYLVADVLSAKVNMLL